MRGGIRARVAPRIKRLERRWIPDPVERAHHDAVVIRRLEQLTGNLAPLTGPDRALTPTLTVS